ncbi:GNAT family N-acetyltransferase [Streptomyces tsukubensis]|uniref:GNAT family N-acetyltransferase n=1 Tax=Streptomyces tsukubensis TaxID=83656 RepID=A0A1V4A7A5_9ACTN|nr:GNAT family N-acetyltransferase [Streptomyces tsukubensis]OON78364.1 GNAT family N-acetyltransferase [Streptomyces tsukubensis]QFR95124.1 GNAT family N-acetyltransferase [Streptomyces tsukubensis]
MSDTPAVESRRISAFRSAFARRQSSRTVELSGGFAVLHGEVPLSQEHNQVIVDGAADPDGLSASADKVLGHLTHRRISVYDDEMGLACVEPLRRAGYLHSAELVMVHREEPPAADPSVEAVRADVLRTPLTRQLRAWMPDASAELLGQLVGRRAIREGGADSVLFLAAHTPRREVASWADLYLDPAAGVAEFEDLITADRYTGRGYAEAVLGTALRRAADAGCGLRFLLADPDDWPRHWYERRGFALIARSHVFVRHVSDGATVPA